MRYVIRWETPTNFHFASVARSELTKTVAEILGTPDATLWGIEMEGDQLS